MCMVVRVRRSPPILFVSFIQEYALPQWANSMRKSVKEIVALAMLLGVTVSELQEGFVAFSMDFLNEKEITA